MEYALRAANPPEGCAEVWGGEWQNRLPYAEQVRYGDCSVAAFTVDGLRVFCIASAERLDALSLRSPAWRAD